MVNCNFFALISIKSFDITMKANTEYKVNWFRKKVAHVPVCVCVASEAKKNKKKMIKKYIPEDIRGFVSFVLMWM